MSLPRADYDPRRVCVNPCPNFTLGFGRYKRSLGVYLAGALVRTFRSHHPFPTRKRIPKPQTNRPFIFGSFSLRALWVILRGLMTVILRPRLVHHRQLDLPGCCDPLGARKTRARHGTGIGARHVRRLGPRDLFSPRNAGR